jgi:hypothetical protein
MTDQSDLKKRLGVWFRWLSQVMLVLLCTGLGMWQLSKMNTSLNSIDTSAEELASTTRVQYEPTTFTIKVSRESDTYKPGKGIPACIDYVRQKLNGDEQSLAKLMEDGYYVVNVTTHSQTGNQTDKETGAFKSESETGYRSCGTTGLLYILRKDLPK